MILVVSLKTYFESLLVCADTCTDIIKLSIISPTIEDYYELGLFIRDYKKEHTKPLLVVGMSTNGQLSRITSPISLINYPLMPFPSASGQLSLAQVHQARYLMGQIPKKEISVNGDVSTAEKAKRALEAAFAELGYPMYAV